MGHSELVYSVVFLEFIDVYNKVQSAGQKQKYDLYFDSRYTPGMSSSKFQFHQMQINSFF